MLGVIRRFSKLFPIGVQSRDDFIVFVKHLGCTSVVAELLAENHVGGVFRCTIRFSAESPGRRVIYRQELFWDKRIMGITLDLENKETRGALSGRLCWVVKPELAKIREEIPDIQASIVDLDGNRLIMAADGRWPET